MKSSRWPLTHVGGSPAAILILPEVSFFDVHLPCNRGKCQDIIVIVPCLVCKELFMAFPDQIEAIPIHQHIIMKTGSVSYAATLAGKQQFAVLILP